MENVVNTGTVIGRLVNYPKMYKNSFKAGTYDAYFFVRTPNNYSRKAGPSYSDLKFKTYIGNSRIYKFYQSLVPNELVIVKYHQESYRARNGFLEQSNAVDILQVLDEVMDKTNLNMADSGNAGQGVNQQNSRTASDRNQPATQQMTSSERELARANAHERKCSRMYVKIMKDTHHKI